MRGRVRLIFKTGGILKLIIILMNLEFVDDALIYGLGLAVKHAS